MKYLQFSWFITKLGAHIFSFIFNFGLILTPFWVLVTSIVFLFIVNISVLSYTTSYFDFFSRDFGQLNITQDNQQQPPIQQQSLEYYRAVLNLQPTHRDLLLNTATLLNQAGQHQAGKLLEEQAATIDPLIFYKENEL